MATQNNNLDNFYGGFAEVLQEQWQVDVQLKGGDSVESESIFAHKLVLAARSKVFRKILEEEECKVSCRMEVITLSEMNHEEVKALVEFMYSHDGSMTCTVHARSLYLASHKYEIRHLQDVCRKELASSLSFSNVFDVFELANIPVDYNLAKDALEYIIRNLSKIVRSDKFKLFVATNPDLTVAIVDAYISRRNHKNYRP